MRPLFRIASIAVVVPIALVFAVAAQPRNVGLAARRLAAVGCETWRARDHCGLRDRRPLPRGSLGRLDVRGRRAAPVAFAPFRRRRVARDFACAGVARRLPGGVAHTGRRVSDQAGGSVPAGLRARHPRATVIRQPDRRRALVGAHGSPRDARRDQSVAASGVRWTRRAPTPSLRRRVQPPGASGRRRSTRDVRHGVPGRLRRGLAATGRERPAVTCSQRVSGLSLVRGNLGAIPEEPEDRWWFDRTRLAVRRAGHTLRRKIL